MSVTSQLYQLQEVDLELESNGQALNQITSQLGESEAVNAAQDKLASERQHLEELTHQQHSVEWEIDDITSKLTTVEKELYSGKIRNPKELTDLQHETDGLKAKRAQLENKALDIMEQVELATKGIAASDSELKRLKAEWQSQQKKLSTDLKQVKTILSNLTHKRELLASEIDPQVVEVYYGLKKQRGTAVAKVEQGLCRGCRISLPVTELQQARSGSLVRCGSCGRILFLA
ncbi:zinc ribbon domain-containing protein [Chloroflexota bacterium]